jgi:peptidyl-Lys metalloendopeptidase
MFFRTLLRASLASALACLSFAAAAGPASPTVSLSLTDRATTKDGEVLVDIVFTNNSNTPIAMVNWYLPDGDLDGDLFAISRDGAPVSYVGRIVKRAPASLKDLVALAPGESVTRTVDLAAHYDLTQSGVYSMQYTASAQEMFGHTAPRGADGKRYSAELTESSYEPVASNQVTSFLEGRANAIIEQSRSLDKSTSFSGRCSATQQSQINSAVGSAQTMANGSVNYLNSISSGTSRFTTWFGGYSAANLSQIKSHYANIKDALDNKPIVYDCSCKQSYYAYVYPTQPYKVYLCRAFWTAPLSGTDSKGGTIVHELSHFNVIAGTSDYAYGQSAAKSLAISNAAQARQNADSHEYFAENTPGLQ